MALQKGRALLRVVLSCLLGWAGPTWALRDPGKDQGAAQGDPYLQAPSEVLGQRLLLWFLALAGFYGLVWILNDFSGEQCLPPRPKDAAIRNWSKIPARGPRLPPRHCRVQSSLRSLRQTEQDLVTLLYKLRKHKVALAAGWLPSNPRSRRNILPNDLVIYTIQDET